MSNSYDDVVFERVHPNLGLQVGDLVTTYHKGYWIVTKIERRFHKKPKPQFHDYRPDWPDGAPIPSLVHYRKVANENGKPVNSKCTNRCCVTLCKIVDKDFICDQYDQETKKAKAKLDGLNSVLTGIKKGEIKP